MDRYNPPVLLTVSYLLLAAQKDVAANWKTQTFSEGVSLEVPVTLKKSSKAIKDAGMTTLELWNAVEGVTSYLITVGRLRDPEKTKTPNLFSASAAGLISGARGTLVGQRDILLQGWPGLATTVRMDDGLTLVARTFRTKDCVVQLGVTFFTARGRPAKIDRFLNSLKLPGEGDLKEPGATLTRYPLGESGLSALFPGPPQLTETPMGKGAKTATLFAYSADYALRTFSVAYLDIPTTEESHSDDELDKARYDLTEEILAGLEGKKGKQTNEKIGEGQGLLTEFTVHNDEKGRILVYFLGARVVILFEMAPRGYEVPKSIEAFLHSVQARTEK